MCTPQRSPLLPDVPTMSEAALPGFVSVAWFGLVAPEGTPDEIVEAINKAVVGVLKTEEVRKKFETHGAERHRQFAGRDGRVPGARARAVGRRDREGQAQGAGVEGARASFRASKPSCMVAGGRNKRGYHGRRESTLCCEAVDKLTEAVDGLEDVVKAHQNAQTKAKMTEYLAKVQEGLDGMFELFPEN